MNIDFVCVGPQRTASSWLDRALRIHPELNLPAHVKETFFFDRHFRRGIDWYFSLFDMLEEGGKIGEVASTYFESYEALERIRVHNPAMKILILVRNPVARSFSSFGHEHMKGRAPSSFFDALNDQPRIVSSGHYAELAPRWEEAFGRERVFYLSQEDIASNPQGALDTLWNFLDVELMALPEELYERYGQASVPRFRWLAAVASQTASAVRAAGFHRVAELGKRLGLKRIYRGGNPEAVMMTRPILEYLLGRHERDIRFLEERLGQSFPHWRDPATYGLERQ